MVTRYIRAGHGALRASGSQQHADRSSVVRWGRWFLIGTLVVLSAAIALTGSGYATLGASGVLAMLVALALNRRTNAVLGEECVVIVGNGPTSLVLAAALTMEPLRYPMGRQRHHVGHRPPEVIHTQSLDDAARTVSSVACGKVVVLDPSQRHWGAPADARGVPPKVVSGVIELERVLGRLPLPILSHTRNVEQEPAVRPLDPKYVILKRAFDLAVALPLAILVLLVLPLIALAIWLDSPGPTFYKQTRLGLGGKPFDIYKFRSMRTDAESNGAAWAASVDHRITRVGKLMRATRIDELPQVWNVIRGDMSLVGPRPERPEFAEPLTRQYPGFQLRTQVKPGLTGWAQISAGYCRSMRESRVKLEYDLYYVDHASLMFDARILLNTVPYVLARRGS